jgi:hypothetical protein
MAEEEPEKFRDLVAFLASLNGEEEAEEPDTGVAGDPGTAPPESTDGAAAEEPASGSSP